MEIKVFADYITMSSAAAAAIINCIQKNPDALLCFATGDTPKLTYQLLVEYTKKDKVDFSKCFMIGLDEWLGIPPDNSGSCHLFLHHYLFHPLSINPSQIHLFDALTTGEEAECQKMNNLIMYKGPIDFMLVGVGMNGHIGFNEPGTDINSLAHISILDNVTKTVGKKYFEQEVQINKGITLGLKHVMNTETLLLLANGKKKSPVVKRAIEGEIDKSFPASFIRQHKNGIVMLDSEAASELEESYK
jgi:galactosamine-6-phosphate isomerase